MHWYNVYTCTYFACGIYMYIVLIFSLSLSAPLSSSLIHSIPLPLLQTHTLSLAADLQPLPVLFSISADSSACVNIMIIDDDKVEETEQFTIELTTDDTKVEFARSNATIEISELYTGYQSFSISHLSFIKFVTKVTLQPLSLPSHPSGVEVSLQLAMYTVDETVGKF